MSKFTVLGRNSIEDFFQYVELCIKSNYDAIRRIMMYAQKPANTRKEIGGIGNNGISQGRTCMSVELLNNTNSATALMESKHENRRSFIFVVLVLE